MVVPTIPFPKAASYAGLRMSAEEYFSLEEDACRYELIDGVVCMSPSPTPRHQKVAAFIVHQIAAHLDEHPLGEVFVEVDVHLGRGPKGGDLVYRPDVVFIRAERVAANIDRIVEPPDLVVEIVSDTSRRYDHETKKSDYERCGVAEYWIIDPAREAATFYRLESGQYIEVKTEGDRFHSTALAGLTLDLARLRRSFRLS
jgi:Uma2 family endonuclease